MDGKITGFTPLDKFTFDLQRFVDVSTITELQAALKKGGEITLKANIESTDTNLAISKDAQLDLGEFTLTAKKITNNASKTLTISGTGTLATPITNNGTLNVNSGTVSKTITNAASATFTQSGGSTAAVTNSGTFTKTDGSNTGTITNNASFEQSGGSAAAITNNNAAAQATISGGTVSGAVKNNKSGAQLTISGSASINGAITNSGTLTIENATNANVTNNGTLTQTGGTTTVTNYKTFNQSGGTTTVTNNHLGTFSVTGGIVNSDLSECVSDDTDYVVLDKKLYVGDSVSSASTSSAKKQEIDGTTDKKYYTLDDNKLPEVAEVDGTKYSTLQKAVKAASAGATIKLLEDCSSDSTVIIDKNVTLDLDDHNLTFGENVTTGITIKNSTDSANPITFTLTDNSTGKTKGKVIGTYDPLATLPSTNANIVKAAKDSRYNGTTGPLIFVGENSTADAKGSTLTVEKGVTIESNNGTICGTNNSTININDSTVQSYMSSAIYLGSDGVTTTISETKTKDAEGKTTTTIQNTNTGGGGQTLNVTGTSTIATGVKLTDSQSQPINNVEITKDKNSNLPAIQVSGNYQNGTKTTTKTNANGNTTITTTNYQHDLINITIQDSAKIYFNNNENDLQKYTADGATYNKGDYIGNPSAIYIGGYAKLTVKDNVEVTSGGTGIEMRSGELEIPTDSNVEVKSTATTYKIREHGNSSGSTTFGAAIAISQHSTNENITTNVKNGKFEAPVAFVVENPQGNETGSTIEANLTGGTYESTDATAAIAAKSSDDRAAVKLKNVTFVGNLQDAVVQSGSGGEPSPAFTVEGTVTIVTKTKDPETGETTETTVTYDADTATLKYTDESGKSYTVQEGWWPLFSNHFLYLVADSTNTLEAKAVATLKPATETTTTTDSETGEETTTTKASETTLELTTGGATEESILPLDMTSDTFKNLAYTTIDASKVTADSNFKLEITGTGYTKTIIGGAGNDTLSAVSTDGVFLDGGIGDDLLIGGDGKDTYAFSGGSDSIIGYTYGTDAVSLATDFTAPTSFDKVSYDGSNLAIGFGENNSLTFNIALNVSVASGNDTYSYKGYSNGGMEYIALNSASSNGISLGAQHSTVFSGTVEANSNYTTIDAANGNKVVRIIGNDKSNYIVSGKQGGTISGGEGADTIIGSRATDSLTLNGGAGDDLLIGGSVYNRFEYSEGKDSIRGYKDDTDVINVTNRTLSFMDATVEAADTNNLLIQFDNANQLSIEGGASLSNAISVTSGSRLYKFTKDYVAHNKGITLTSGYDVKPGDVVTFDGASDDFKDYETINAAAVNNAISVMGNSLGNYIFGATQAGGSINGGIGNDKINVSDRSDGASYLFEYTEGKDEVIGFNATKDTVDIAVENITAAKASNSNSKLALTVDKNKNVLTLRGEDEIEKVSLSSDSGAEYLTKDGYVSGQGFSLFGSARGAIDLKDALYAGSIISLVAADSVKSQSVTLTGGEQGGTFIYAENNKKRDGFIYGGGAVSISGYEAGRDRIDLNAASLTSFTVGDDANGDVVLTVGDGTSTGTISISGAAGQEVLLRDTSKGNGYKKMVFAQTGVIENKAKNPTIVTVSGAAANYSAADTPTIKKIYVTGIGREGFSVQAGDRNNTQIDASAAGQAVSLSGGAKNDKLIGNTVASANDLFVYSAGKDVLQGYSEGDSISISSGLASSLGSAKITAGSKSIKFQFTNKNTLTIKSNSSETLSNTLNINGEEKTYAKNAIESGGQATLTSAFSGTFNTASTKGIDGAVSTVDGSAVSKNLTYKGSTAAESLVGGTRKTTFKGAGGADTLVGGTGKDIFFYAKNDAGTTTIADFEFGANKDKLKIANGTISEIATVTAANDKIAIQFAMNSGKNTANVGWFQVTSGKDNPVIDATKVAIKANNTYYWFNQDSTAQDSDGNAVAIGQLITSDSRVSASDVSGLSVIDLNYSTNLAKAGVAVKVTGAKPK